MILLTVGTQLPFCRFVSLVDKWCETSKEKVIAQVGADSNSYRFLDVINFIPVNEFEEIILETSLIVSHAGMGSILTALKYNKPIILFPRDAGLSEHRNNHQQATLRAFKDTPGVYAAFNERELIELLDNRHDLKPSTLNVSSEYEKLGSFINKVLGSR